MEKAKSLLVDFFNTLSIYDYIGFIVTFILFLLFLILALILRKRTILSIVLLLCSFVFFFGGPVMAHLLVKNTFYKARAEITERKQLYYSDTLILRGSLHYLGKKDAEHCRVEALIYKKGSNIVKDFVYRLKAYRSVSKEIDQKF